MPNTYSHTDETKRQISNTLKEYYRDKQHLQEKSEATKKGYTDDLRKQRSERLKQMWSDTEFRERMSQKHKEYFSSEDARTKQSKLIRKAREKDPTISERQSASIRKAMADPEYRKKRSKLSKEMWDDAHRQNQSKYSKAWWENSTPEKRSSRVAKIAKSTSNTSIERKVCEQLSKYKIHFNTQEPILGGRYFLDIVLYEYNIAIECNGDYWHKLPDRVERDKRLEEDIKKTPYTLITIWEHEIKDEDFDVMMYITDYLDRSKHDTFKKL